MYNFALKPILRVFTGAMLLLICFTSACQQQPATNVNTGSNTNTSNVTVTNTSNGNTATTMSGTTVTAREPDQYSATVTLKAEVTGGQSISIPALSATFARNGADRRIAFKVPGGDEVIYLDSGNKRYVILPNRKQYAEIDAKSIGFDVPAVMTPAQIVNQAKGMSGCELVGDEQFGGRSAVKYRCAGGVKTGTKAGDATAESFIYVDKETNLPLHTFGL